jgi:hypothetical protein
VFVERLGQLPGDARGLLILDLMALHQVDQLAVSQQGNGWR